jgi:peroxiredoxin
LGEYVVADLNPAPQKAGFSFFGLRHFRPAFRMPFLCIRMPMFPVRSLFTVLAAIAGLAPLKAQQVEGTIKAPSAAGASLVLSQVRGGGFVPLDSVHIGAGGRFAFPAAAHPRGFYRLALHDTDAVSLILDPHEPLVRIECDSLPLQLHLLVIASDENKRLEEFGLVSRETDSVFASVARQRARALPFDTATLGQLQRVEERASDMRVRYLDQLIANAPNSYFAKVLRADRAIRDAARKQPADVVAAFNFSDPELLRSSVYDRAVMTYLQNLHAMNEEAFAPASDSLVRLAGGDPDCRSYMIGRLVDLFATYGPNSALEHVIGSYVSLADTAHLEPALRKEVEALLKVAIGSTAPDIELNDSGRTEPLSDLVRANTYTALFFYSSTCEHCHAQMPALKADLEQYRTKGFNVIGIALDTDSADFLASIRENNIPWKCFSEFMGWGARSATAFMVKATPSFYLLDNRMKIVAKPTDADELGNKLAELFQ